MLKDITARNWEDFNVKYLIYRKTLDGHISLNNPTKHLLDYVSIQGVNLPEDTFRLNQVEMAGA